MAIEFVRQQIKMLNYEWYLAKREFFKKEPFYHSSLDKIHETIPATSGIETKDGILMDDDITVDIDIKQYCWNHNFPDSLSHDGNVEELLPINSSFITEEIIQWIESSISDIADNEAKYRVIMIVIDAVKEEIETLVKLNGDKDEYISILDNFLILFRGEISSKFSRIKQIHNLSTEYSERERLEFNLNQEELGALLFLLHRAEIIHSPTPTDTSFINFCSDRFYFRNQKAKGFTKARDLRGKFNDAKQPICKARDKIIQLLKETFKEL